jgi:nucleotide-binding universal stress UspA family protein
MGHIRKILVPMDDSSPSRAALAEALTLADDLGGASIDILEVQAPDEFQVGSGAPVAPEAREQARRTLEESVEAAKVRLGNRLRRRTVTGEPTQTILGTAQAEGHDLVVMGTHGRVGRLQGLAGSVAASVLRSSPCPVLTVRSADGSEESFSERVHERPSPSDHSRASR